MNDEKKPVKKNPIELVAKAIKEATKDTVVEIKMGEPPKKKLTLYGDSLYSKLSVPVPKEMLITFTIKEKTFTGYHAQYAIDLLNKEVGIGKWYTEEEVLVQEMLKKGWMVAMRLSIFIDGCDKPVTGYGGFYARKIEDVFKGAKTSAFKNACRYLGIGKELYSKGFEDDIKEDEEEPEIKEDVDMPTESQDLSDKIKNAKTIDEVKKFDNIIKNLKAGNLKNIIVDVYNKKLLELQ